MDLELRKADLDYFQRGIPEVEKFWYRFGGRPNMDATFLDVGCGHGALCIDLAKTGAKKVVGIDIDEGRIAFAKNNLKLNYPELTNRVEFHAIDLKDFDESPQFDFMTSKDSFEHIIDLESMVMEMKKRLKPNGLIYAGFGPLYRDFYGDHKRTESVIPWGHLMRSEKSIINKLNKKKEEPITSIYDLGLNKLSVVEYRNIFKNSGLEIVSFKLNRSKNLILRVFHLLGKLPYLQEYFAHNIYCILKKKK